MIMGYEKEKHCGQIDMGNYALIGLPLSPGGYPMLLYEPQRLVCVDLQPSTVTYRRIMLMNISFQLLYPPPSFI